MKKIEIPDEILLLPLRNTVLFPGVVLPITVGRDKSIKAVNEAYKGTKLIGVLAQKDSSVEDPQAKDLEAIGTRSPHHQANKNARRRHHHHHTRQKPFCGGCHRFGGTFF